MSTTARTPWSPGSAACPDDTVVFRWRSVDDLTIAPYDLMMDGSTALADDIVAASTGPAGVLVLAPVARCGLPDADLADVGFGLFIVAPDDPPRGAGLAPDGPCVHAAAWLP